MGIMIRPTVRKLTDGGKFWEHEYEHFYLKAYVPKTDIDGTVLNYGFKAPMLIVFEETKKTEEEAIAFAKKSGLADIAASYDSSVLFVYPTCDGGWDNADVSLYKELIANTRIDPRYEDGIVEYYDFPNKQFRGYYIRGAIYRADIFSFGKSADYCAKNLIQTIDGEYLWGPGEITPIMISMEGLSVVPDVRRKDIAIISVGNSLDVNEAFESCEHVMIKDKSDYVADFKSFIWKYKMWCGKVEIEPDFNEIGMVAEPGDGYFAYYNKDVFDNGPAPLVIGFHGGGDSALFLTYVSGWWEVCHKHNFLFVAIENHQNVTPTKAIEMIEGLKKRYNIDEKRIYATGFSMGSAKTWDMFQEYPDVFAAVAPQSALFPVKDNPFGKSLGDPGMNTSVSVPIFYAGGVKSPLPELPFQANESLERIQYAASVNKLKINFDVDFSDKDNWEDKIYGIPGDRVEKFKDPSTGGVLTVNYYDSEDGVCRTAFGSVDNQVHECREHTCEVAWNFMSSFTK